MSPRFPDHSRVVFIGDSITAVGLWVAHVYDHYLRAFPDADIRMYNAGISGGSAVSALRYLDDNGLNYRPTHAVIMLGMNDVDRDGYRVNKDGEYTNKDVSRWQAALEKYEAGMRELAGRLLEKGISLTFVSPTCLDESTAPRTINMIGCDAALEFAGEITRRLAEELHSPFISMHAPFRLMNAARPVINEDRVHPSEAGYFLMSRIFLAAQGLIPEPTLTSLSDLPTQALLPENQARYKAEQVIRDLWNAEWLIFQNVPHDIAAREETIRTYPYNSPYINGLIAVWREHAQKKDVADQLELDLTEACVKK